MKTLMLCLLGTVIPWMAAHGGALLPYAPVVSPKGTYVFDRLDKKGSDFVLWKTKPQRIRMKGFTLEGGTFRYPYYDLVWSKDEAYFALEWSIHHESDPLFYRVEGTKVIAIEVPDFQAIMMAKEKAVAAAKGIKEVSPRESWVEDIQFVEGNQVTFHYANTDSYPGQWPFDSVHSFRIRIKGDQASVMDYRSEIQEPPKYKPAPTLSVPQPPTK